MTRIRELYLAMTSAAALSISAGAMAQTAVPNETADREATSHDQGVQLSEIVVTANRRSERAQTVPIAIAAISGEQALSSGVTDTVSLANAVPGLRVDRTPGSSTPFLRGVGNATSTTGSEPSVSLYVDDVYIPAGSAFFSNFNNIDRVEVLKGPQGTLFGRNATGGVIQVFTRDPSDSPKLDISAGYANFDTVNGSLYASGGLVDGVSANIAVYGGNQGEGWGKNLTTGKDSFQTNWNYGGRIKLLFEPSGETRVLLTVDHDTTASSQGYYHPAPGTVAYGSFPGTSGFYDMLDDLDPRFKASQSGVSAKISQEMSWAKAVSISAYRDTTESTRDNLAGVAVPFIRGNFRSYNKTFTQELQLLSPHDSAVTWLAGFYYMRDRAAYDPLELSGLVFGPVPLYGFTVERTASYSGFGQAMVSVMQNTHLTSGLRYTSDDRELRATWAIPGVASGPAPNSPQSKVFDKLTWRASLDHQFTSDIMAYASYNRGFRSGGFNLVVVPTAAIDAPVAPETLDAFAIGEKAEFLDRRLQVNTEAFYYKYKNIQVITIGPTGGTVQSNAAAASIKGIDVDVKAIPVANLTLTASFEYLNARYDQYVNGTLATYSPGCAPIQSNCNSVADLSGFKMPFAAPFSASLVANYLHPTSIGSFDLNVAYNHGGNYYFSPDDGRGQSDPSLNKQRDLNLVNTSLSWASKDGKYDLTLWGRNITGQRYLTFAAELTVGTIWGPAAPATYGVTLGAHF